MSMVLGRFSTPISFRVMGKAVQDFELSEKLNDPISFQGVLVPQTPQQIRIKPEGQRSWKWWTCYTTQELTLDWIVTDSSGVMFRVMERANWGSYSEYGLRENPTL